jgi:hypothetical protein
MYDRFRKELENLINKQSMENGSDTPDMILANYLTDCLRAFDMATTDRTKWYNRATKEAIDASCIQGSVSFDASRKAR